MAAAVDKYMLPRADGLYMDYFKTLSKETQREIVEEWDGDVRAAAYVVYHTCVVELAQGIADFLDSELLEPEKMKSPLVRAKAMSAPPAPKKARM